MACPTNNKSLTFRRLIPKTIENAKCISSWTASIAFHLVLYYQAPFLAIKYGGNECNGIYKNAWQTGSQVTSELRKAATSRESILMGRLQELETLLRTPSATNSQPTGGASPGGVSSMDGNGVSAVIMEVYRHRHA